MGAGLGEREGDADWGAVGVGADPSGSLGSTGLSVGLGVAEGSGLAPDSSADGDATTAEGVPPSGGAAVADPSLGSTDAVVRVGPASAAGSFLLVVTDRTRESDSMSRTEVSVSADGTDSAPGDSAPGGEAGAPGPAVGVADLGGSGSGLPDGGTAGEDSVRVGVGSVDGSTSAEGSPADSDGEGDPSIRCGSRRHASSTSAAMSMPSSGNGGVADELSGALSSSDEGASLDAHATLAPRSLARKDTVISTVRAPNQNRRTPRGAR